MKMFQALPLEVKLGAMPASDQASHDSNIASGIHNGVMPAGASSLGSRHPREQASPTARRGQHVASDFLRRDCSSVTCAAT
jgi:hypothetical protein